MSNTDKELLVDILRTQYDLNAVVNANWLNTPTNWLRAVWVEAGEAMGYLPWPWWKGVRDTEFKNASDRNQFYLELADIFCFGLSYYMQTFQETANHPNLETLFADVANSLASSIEHSSRVVERGHSVTELVEAVASAALHRESFFSSSKLIAAAEQTGLGYSGLVAYYYGKQALNHFRQANGYKAGTYRKNWGTITQPAEDNIYLAEIIEEYRKLFGPEDLIGRIRSGHFTHHVAANLGIQYRELRPLQ